MSEWRPIETAPRDGTPVYLLLDNDRVVAARWWTRDYVIERVGKKKASQNARGALIEKLGGYWGSAGLKSKPLALRRQPNGWVPMPEEDLFPRQLKALVARHVINK